MTIISVKHRLPTKSEVKNMNGFMLVFHQEGMQLDGKIGFFDPNKKTWAIIGNPSPDENGELAYPLDDVTDWVDCWAIATLDEMNEMKREGML